jgi:hypothetical protein
MGLFILEISHGRGFGHSLTGLLLIGAMWYRSAFAMLVKQTVARFDDSRILELKSRIFEISQPVSFTNVEKVFRFSPTCIEVTFKSNVPIKNSGYRSQVSRTGIKVLKVNGNEDEIERFCKKLADHGVNVIMDSIPDDDPTKQTAILFLSLFIIFVGVCGVLVFAVTHASR